MTIEASYHSEVRFVRSSYSSKTGTTITLALPDSDELAKVQGFDGKRYMLALVEIGDDEQPVQPKAGEVVEKMKGGHLARQAGIWCDTPHFWGWLESVHHMPVKNSNKAADVLREMLGIGSRAELDNNESAAERFQTKIRAPFMKYMARFSCPEEVTA